MIISEFLPPPSLEIIELLASPIAFNIKIDFVLRLLTGIHARLRHTSPIANGRNWNANVSREMSQLILRYVPATPRMWGNVTPVGYPRVFFFDAKSFRAITKLKIGHRWCPTVRNLPAFSRNAYEIMPLRQSVATRTSTLGKRRVETRISSPLPLPPNRYYSTTFRRN